MVSANSEDGRGQAGAVGVGGGPPTTTEHLLDTNPELGASGREVGTNTQGAHMAPVPANGTHWSTPLSPHPLQHVETSDGSSASAIRL